MKGNTDEENDRKTHVQDAPAHEYQAHALALDG